MKNRRDGKTHLDQAAYAIAINTLLTQVTEAVGVISFVALGAAVYVVALRKT